jgi:general secretion pathway protein I
MWKHRRSTPWRGRRGLALVEVLVAVVILGIGIAAGWRSVSASTVRQEQVRDRIYAHWVAQDVLARMHAERIWPVPGQREYPATQAGQSFVVREEVADTPNAAFRMVRLRVSGAAGEAEALAELVGFVRAPVAGARS